MENYTDVIRNQHEQLEDIYGNNIDDVSHKGKYAQENHHVQVHENGYIATCTADRYNSRCFMPSKDGKPPTTKTKQKFKESLDHKTKEYINAFTVHGLTRILTTTRCESLFWFFILICGIFLASYIIHSRLTKFYKYEIYTEISSKITKTNPFPAISFCEANLLVNTFFAYCGKSIRSKHKDNSKPCSLIDRHFNDLSVTVQDGEWSNGLFNFTRCQTWGGKKCATRTHLKSAKRYNHSCVTWNYDGNFIDNIYGHVELSFHFISPFGKGYSPIIYAIPHDPGVEEIDLTKKVHLDPRKVYDIKVDKSMIKRLPHPYPSNCTNGKHGDIFPGKYSRRGCIESHNYINMFKECGDTLDYVRNFMPNHMIKTFEQNKSIEEVKLCIFSYSKKEASSSYDCPFPCHAVDISVLPTSHEEILLKFSPYSHTYFVNIQFEHIDTIRTIQEKELYSWYQMACEIGGFVGLVIGASLISCIEVLVYVLLLLFRKCL